MLNDLSVMSRFLAATLLLTMLGACSNEQAPPPLSGAPSALKVPVTTLSPTALDAYLTGRALFESLRTSESLVWFERALDADPDFAMAHLMRARLAENAGRFYRHLELAEAALDDVSAGEQLIIRAFRAASEDRRDDQAQHLKKLVALYPGDERAQMALGTFYVVTRQFSAARTHLSRAIEIAPDFAPAFNMLGYAFRGQGDFDSAKLTFQRYVELVPDQPNPYDSYAELLMEAGDYEESIAMYRRALEIDPNFGNSYYGVMLNYSMLGLYERALAAANDMRAAARNVIEHHKARLAVRQAHLFAGELDAALAVSDEIASAAMENDSFERLALAHELAADVHVFRGQTDAALRNYQTAYDIRRDAGITEIGKQRARLQFLFKTTLAALQSRRPLTAAQYLEQYEQAIRESGSTVDRQRAFELNGIADILSGKYDEALVNLKQADQFDPIVQYFLALAYQQVGDRKLARLHAKNAAYRNVLDPRLAYFHRPAVAMLEALETSIAAKD